MGLGTVFNIVARYSVDAGQAKAQASGLAAAFDEASRSGERLLGRLSSFGGIGAALGLGGASIGLTGLITKMGKLTEAATEGRIEIASVLTLNNLGSFESNMTRAQGLLEKFTKASKATKGESKDLLQIVNTALPSFASINPSDLELVKFGQRGLAAANVLLKGQTDIAGSQFLQIFSGQAGSDNRLFQAIRQPLFERLGIAETGSKGVEAFNKLAQKDTRKLFTAVNGVLETFDKANGLLMNTMSGQWATLTENVNGFLKRAGGKLFGSLTFGLGDVNKWVEKNQKSIDDLADKVGSNLAKAFNVMGKAAKFAANNVEYLAAAGGTLLVMRAIGTQNVVNGLLGLPTVLASGARAGAGRALAAGRAGAGRLAGGARSGLGSIASFLVPEALAATDAYRFRGRGQRAVLAAQFNAWRAGGALRGARTRGIAALGLDSLVGTASFAAANRRTQARLVAGMLARGGAAQARRGVRGIGAAFEAATGLGALRASDRFAFATRGQRAAMMTRAVGGAAVRGGAAGVRGVVGGARRFGGAVASGVGSLVSATGLGGVATAFGALLKVAGPLAVVVLAVAGAFKIMQDRSSEARKNLIGAFDELRTEADKLAGVFGFGAGEGGAAGAIKSASMWLGEKLVGGLTLVTKGLKFIVSGLDDFALMLETISGALGFMYAQYQKGGIMAVDPDAAFAGAYDLAKARRDARERDARILDEQRKKKRAQDEEDRKKKELARKTASKKTIKIELNQTIQTDSSPDRIAFKTLEFLEDTLTRGRLSTAELFNQ